MEKGYYLFQKTGEDEYRVYCREIVDREIKGIFCLIGLVPTPAVLCLLVKCLKNEKVNKISMFGKNNGFQYYPG